MSDSESTLDGSQPLTARQAALADIAERRRKDPNWNYQTDSTYSGPHPTLVPLMSDAAYERHMALREEERRQPWPHPYLPRAIEHIQPSPRPQPVPRACLPFGQRIRDVRRALGWTQREAALQLGVSARSVIRYEQGRSAPVQAAPLLALRRLELAYAQELDCAWK